MAKSKESYALELAEINLTRHAERDGIKDRHRQNLRDFDRLTRKRLSEKKQEFDAWLKSEKTAAAASA